MQIGNKTDQSPNKIEEQMGRDGRLITTPPQLNLLCITQQSFRRIVDQYLWQYAINNDDGEHRDSGTASSCPQPDCTSGSPPAASADEVANTLANKKHKLNEDKVVDVPDDDNVSRLYPHLCRALGLDDGFDPTNPSVRKSLVALLTKLNRSFSTEYELVI